MTILETLKLEQFFGCKSSFLKESFWTKIAKTGHSDTVDPAGSFWGVSHCVLYTKTEANERLGGTKGDAKAYIVEVKHE